MGRFTKANHGVPLSLPPPRQHMSARSRKRTDYSMTKARKQRPARRRRLTLSTWCTLPDVVSKWDGPRSVPGRDHLDWAKAECKQRLGLKDKPR